MAYGLQDKINQILGVNQKSEEEKQLENYQKSINKLRDTAQKEYNPFLKKDGSLVNKYIDYQSAINNPNTAVKAKEWMKKATGLSEAANENADESQTFGFENGGFKQSGGRRGFISAKYETGGYDGGLVSSGNGDYGGVSYGIPQFSTATGSANSFVKWLKSAYPEMGNYFGSASAGSQDFGNAWKQVYQKFGDRFSKAQTDYAYSQFVQPLVKLAKQKTGIDYTRSET